MKIKIVVTKDCKYGKRGEIKQVAPVFFNNVLAKQSLAVKYGTSEANNILEKIKKQQNKLNKEIEKINKMLTDLEKNGLNIEKTLTPAGHFYDKIDEKEISNFILKNYGIKIPTNKIKLNEKIKEPGTYKINISYHGINKTISLIAKGK